MSLKQSSRRLSRALALIAPLAAVLAGAGSPASRAEPADQAADQASDPWRVCGAYVEQAERALELPPRLLHAISKVESGRWDEARSALSAWPWTVMAEGRGRYLPSMAAAIAEVEALKAKGVRNIDVGCMQVNLQFHPQAFDSLEQAFDPAQNVAYAAVFLSQLRRESNSWTRAIGRYHSATPALMGRYRLKVFRAWREEKRQAERERRAARQAQAASREAQNEIREARRPARSPAAGAVLNGARLTPASYHRFPG